MKIFRYILMPFLVMLCAGKAFAASDGPVDRLYRSLSSSFVEISYTYSSEVKGVKIVGSGILQIQDEMWHNDGNGLEMWCDGSTVWTADHSLKEAVIEPVYEDESIASNPAVMFVRMPDMFKVVKSLDSKDGKAVVYVLKPVEDAPVEYFNVEVMKSDSSIRSGSFALDDGSAVSISVQSMSVKEKRPVTVFRPSQIFDSSWVVTDLR